MLFTPNFLLAPSAFSEMNAYASFSRSRTKVTEVTGAVTIYRNHYIWCSNAA